MLKKIIILSVLLVLLSISVSAANITGAYKWLNDQKPTDVYAASLASLALRRVNGGTEFVKFLDEKKDSTGCWPSGSCKPKETALATLVMFKEGKNIDASLAWLKSHQDISLTGEWLLQIDTSSTGECGVEYEGKTDKIKVDRGYITSTKCSNPNTLFNLGNCLESGLFSRKASVEFDIKCDVDGKISSLYNEQGIFYLNDDVVTGGNAKITVNNGNFGDYDSTLFTNWALKELNSNINSQIFLRKNFKDNDIKSNAFLYLITKKTLYANQLGSLQSEEGSFNNVFDTAIALLALDDGEHQTQTDLGRQFLDRKQKETGSWNDNIADTALVLYGVYPISGIDLGGSARASVVEESKETSCNNDGVCDIAFGENSLQCRNDCSCGDNICDSSETSSSCSSDCKETDETTIEEPAIKEPVKEEGRSYTFLWGLLIIILLGVIGFFAYKKFGNVLFKSDKNNQKPVFDFSKFTKLEKKEEFKEPGRMPIFRPVPARKETKSKIEKDIERSLKEAKRILEK
ncbi:hypothetical protein HYX16_00260 [Candidatus Woesearchaeota archaeon]|nr:hypothetical protein [Candidatus Woesearchaeota archaeon]